MTGELTGQKGINSKIEKGISVSVLCNQCGFLTFVEQTHLMQTDYIPLPQRTQAAQSQDVWKQKLFLTRPSA